MIPSIRNYIGTVPEDSEVKETPSFRLIPNSRNLYPLPLAKKCSGVRSLIGQNTTLLMNYRETG